MNKLWIEFNLIREAFLKVKKDVSNSKGAIIDLDNKKADKEDIRVLVKELSMLRREIETISNTKVQTKVVEKESKKGGYDLQIVGNKNSQKVHSSNCPYGKKISKENLVAFDTVKEAINKGYSRCACVLSVR